MGSEYKGWLTGYDVETMMPDDDMKKAIVDVETDLFQTISMICLKYGATFTVGDGNQINIDCPGPKEKEVKLALEIRDGLMRLGILED